MVLNIIGIVSVSISLIFLINVIISQVIFNELKYLDNYFYYVNQKNLNKYYLYGIIYIFKIKETIDYERYIYYKSELKNIYLNMSPIHKPKEKIREMKNNINLYERRIKIEKIKKKTKLNILKRIYS